MKRMIELAAAGLAALTFSACSPPDVSSYQGSTNNPESEEEQAKQPPVNQ